jgi:hypothetical protein
MARRRTPHDPALRVIAAVCVSRYHDALAETLAALARQSLAREAYEIVVVCDSDDLTTRRFFKEDRVADHRLVAAGARWPSRARRIVAEQGGAPVLAFVAAGAIPDTRWLEAVCGAFLAYGDSGRILGGRVTPDWPGSRPAWLNDDLLAYLSVVNLGDAMRFIAAGERFSCANFAVRKEHVHFVDLFDEQLDRALKDGPPGVADAAPLLDQGVDSEAGAFYCPAAVVRRPVPAECLTQAWFRRRAAWQAAIDRQLGPGVDAGALAERWASAKAYLAECAANQRTIRGLALPQKSARRFHAQVSAVYDTVYSLLGGVRESDD